MEPKKVGMTMDPKTGSAIIDLEKDNERILKENYEIEMKLDEIIKYLEVNKLEESKTTVINKIVNENADSIEIGTPSKGGAIKVYGDFDDAVAFKKKLDNAKDVREYANANIAVNI